MSICCGDVFDNSGNLVGVDVVVCNVVGDELWFSIYYDEIVDEYVDEVKINGVVNVYSLGNGYFGVNFIS